MGCVDDNQASAFVEGRLSRAATETVELHIDRCSGCRKLVGELARLMSAPAMGFAAPLPHGATVGRYEIRERIGAGAMGVVYRAHDPELARDVALKLWSTAALGSDRADDVKVVLRREARALAQVCDPHVVRIYDAAVRGDEIYIAMELVEGATLWHWSRERARHWRDIVRVFVDAGRGLAAIHAVGLVHRDVKPENVLVGRDGRARIADFGLACAAAYGVAAAGTPRYMAPEQRGGQFDARSDQYSFCRALAETLGAIRVPAALGAAIARGSRTDPAQRFARMDDLLAALGAALTRRRRPYGLAAACVALLLLRGADAERPRSAAAHLLIGEAIGLAAAGRGSAAGRTAQVAAGIAHRAGDREAEAEALYRAGVYDEPAGLAAREDALFASVRAAEAGGHDLAAARSWIMLALFTVTGDHDKRQGERWGAHAAASLERAGGDAALELELAGATTINAIVTNDLRTAEDTARAALARTEAAFGEHHIQTSRAHNLVGFAAAARKDRDTAVSEYRRAVTIAEAVGDPDLPQYLTNLGEAVRGREGVRLIERALALQQAARGPHDPYVAEIRRTLADVAR